MAKAAVVTNLRMASLNASSTKQYLGFRYGRPISSGETITIVFSGGFTGKPFIGENTTEVVRQGGPDPYNFKVESWDQETETLVIRCNQDIPEEENVYVNITNLNAPSTGVLPRLRQGITLSTDEDFGTLAFRGVKVGRPILVASQAAVAWVEDELGQHEERRDVGRREKGGGGPVCTYRRAPTCGTATRWRGICRNCTSPTAGRTSAGCT